MEDGVEVTETIAGGTVVTITGNALIAFLQSRVNDNGLVTFITTYPGTEGRGYGLATKENATAAYQPMLQITYIPEPATMVLLGLGGLLSIRRKR